MFSLACESQLADTWAYYHSVESFCPPEVVALAYTCAYFRRVMPPLMGVVSRSEAFGRECRIVVSRSATYRIMLACSSAKAASIGDWDW